MGRQYPPVDRLLIRLQDAVTSLTPPPRAARPNPGADVEDAELSAAERRHAAGLMRVNHAGEVAAQALYQGHALVARSGDIRRHMLEAAVEERSHLAWCEERLKELGVHVKRFHFGIAARFLSKKLSDSPKTEYLC